MNIRFFVIVFLSLNLVVAQDELIQIHSKIAQVSDYQHWELEILFENVIVVNGMCVKTYPKPTEIPSIPSTSGPVLKEIWFAELEISDLHFAPLGAAIDYRLLDRKNRNGRIFVFERIPNYAPDSQGRPVTSKLETDEIDEIYVLKFEPTLHAFSLVNKVDNGKKEDVKKLILKRLENERVWREVFLK